MVTVDAVVFSGRDRNRQVALIRRKNNPFAGSWALPGGFLDMEETLDAAAARELEEETGLAGIPLKQFYTFGDPGRDPRGRSISVAFYGFIPLPAPLGAADDAAEAAWFPVSDLPPVAFDHDKIIFIAQQVFQG
ncbi:MAG: NUDIX hydrolase [Candidatus Hydrogenedentes bacterium]|nr:NUDIX hydrolase [Candidatus Hydrogenedentota bacterium]